MSASPVPVHAAPATRRELVAVIRDGPLPDTCFVPLGGGRHWGRGARTRREPRGLDLRGLNRVVDHPVDDLTITVEAGCLAETLRRRLEDAGQWLPALPAGSGESTVGGLLSADVRGVLAGARGTWRDHVLRVVLLDGRGQEVVAGAKVVKSVAGYDLMKLAVGGLGCFGPVVEVTLRVLPRPPARGGVRAPTPEPARRGEILFEAVSSWWPDAVLQQGSEWIVLVSGNEHHVEDALRRAAAALPGATALSSHDVERTHVELESRVAWGGRWLGWGGALPGFLAQWGPPLHTGERAVFDMLRGHVWWTFAGAPSADRLDELRAGISSGEGHLHLDAPAGSERCHAPWGRPGSTADTLGESIRDALDPGGVWPAGRFPGGGA